MGPISPRYIVESVSKHYSCASTAAYLDAIRLDSNEAVQMLASPPIAPLCTRSNVRLLGRHVVEVLSLDVMS